MNSKIMENRFGQSISRRGFFKISAAACAVTAAPTMLVGCKAINYPADNCLSQLPVTSIGSGKKIFESAFFGPIRVKNRLVRSATTFMAADEYGRPTEKTS